MNHKYGFHINRTGADVLDAVRRIKPRVVKVLDHNVDFCREIRAIVPDVFLIGRLVVTPHEQNQFVHDPAGTGRAFAERILRIEANRMDLGGRKLIDAWESYNEVMSGAAAPDIKRKYDDFQVAFAAPIKSAGFQPIAMNFATGNMLGDDFLAHFRGTLEAYDYLGFHEYDWPDMRRLHEKNIREKGEDGMWLALRYRRIMNEVRRHYPGRHKVIITECGMTQGVFGGQGQDVGWLHSPTVPQETIEEVRRDTGVEVVPHVPEERYWDSLKWYNRELMRDDYVQGALLFVVGAISPWQSFEHLGGIIGRLETFQQREPSQPEEPVEPQASLGEKLLARAAGAQPIQFNPRVALQKRIFGEGFVPSSVEFEVEHQGILYVAQQAMHTGTGEVRIYHVATGDWDNVAHLTSAE